MFGRKKIAKPSKKKYETNENEIRALPYRLLSRMKQDCDYYLGNGERYNGHLTGGTPQKHIQEMKSLRKSLPLRSRPRWLTKKQIKNYEKKMCL